MNVLRLKETMFMNKVEFLEKNCVFFLVRPETYWVMCYMPLNESTHVPRFLFYIKLNSQDRTLICWLNYEDESSMADCSLCVNGCYCNLCNLVNNLVNGQRQRVCCGIRSSLGLAMNDSLSLFHLFSFPK